MNNKLNKNKKNKKNLPNGVTQGNPEIDIRKRPAPWNKECAKDYVFAGHDGYVMKIYFSIKQINLNQISWFPNIFLPWQEYRNKEYFKATF